MVNTKLATIPFSFARLADAHKFQETLMNRDVLVDSRSDYAVIEQAHPNDYEDHEYYVIIHTGNVLGMIADLQDENLI